MSIFDHGVTTDGECVISEEAWRESASKLGEPTTALLLLLKQHGAPISGIVYLWPDMKNFIWQREDTFYAMKFKWRRKNGTKAQTEKEEENENEDGNRH